MVPHYVHAGLAAPKIGLIDDIVVYQAGRVNHLGDHGHLALLLQRFAGDANVIDQKPLQYVRLAETGVDNNMKNLPAVFVYMVVDGARHQHGYHRP